MAVPAPIAVTLLPASLITNQFPQITIRDMVKAHILLRKHLQIDAIHLLVGGSMGGYQALEWALYGNRGGKKPFPAGYFCY